MELRKFSAANMREAMDLVRQELGEEAVILDTRSIRETDIPGHPPIERVEVWAQLYEAAAATPESVATIRTMLPTTPPAAASPALPVEDSTTAPSPQVEQQLDGLKEQLSTVHAQLDLLAEGMNWLGTRASGLGGELAAYVGEELANKLPYSGGIRLTGAPHVVALVGPTGVGKTTTIAKLAWAYAVCSGRTIGVICTDTMRVGGVEQMSTYCQHMGVQCAVVYQPEEMSPVLEQLAGCELVLIDTPGGSQRDADYLQELEQLLQAADPAEVHLVVNAGSSSLVIRDVIQRYALLHPDQLIFTKLDEMPSLLEVFPLVHGSGLALSYFGTGPTVSANLEIASPATVAHYLMQS